MITLITRRRRRSETINSTLFIKNIIQTITFSTTLKRSHGKTIIQRLHFHVYSHRIGDKLKKIKPWLRLTYRDPVNQ